MTTPPTPSYNPQIPQSTDTIADSQKEFLNNFSTLFSAFATNHVALNDATNPGNHNVIELLQQISSKTTNFQEISEYSKLVAGQTEQLFMRYQLNGKEFQISNYQIFEIVGVPLHASSFTFLPGGIIVYFGFVLCDGSTSFNIELNPVICTNIMGINLCGIGRLEPQPNVSLEKNALGFYQKVVLTSSRAMTNNFYLVFGNT